MKKIILYILLFTLSFVLSGQINKSHAVDTLQDDPYIKWVASLNSDEVNINQGFFTKIFNFIVGSEPVVINNPVGVYASSLQDYWILNQGDGLLLHYHDGKIEKPALFKKSVNSFPSLVAVCEWGANGILFVDSRLNGVFSLTADGKQCSPFVTTNDLMRPTGIAYSEITDEIWVVETALHQISVFDRNGKKLRTIGHRGCAKLEFNFPTYIWIDKSGKIYIVDSMNFRIQILSRDGEFVSCFGQQGNVTGCFARPRGIATDSNGNIYVVDALFNAVQIFDINGTLLYYFGSQGRGKYQFWMPSGIFIDKRDYIYISDSYNGRVQIFQVLKN